MKNGFVLIELLIATLITSMISLLLLTALQQINKFQAVIDDTIAIYTRAAIFHHQLEKDIMGAFIPIQAYKQQHPPNNKKEEKPPLDQVFYSSNQDKKLGTLTFITTNPLAVYWGVKTGSARPRVARIVYKLRPDDKNKESFTLFRQEGNELAFSHYKKDNPKAPRAYQLIDGIKDLSVTYTIVEKQKEADKKQPTYKTVTTWNWPQKDSQDKKEKEPLPQFITINLVLWDNNYKRDISFTFTFALLIEAKKEKSPQSQQKLKSEQQKNLQKTPARNIANNQQQATIKFTSNRSIKQ